MSLFFKLPNAIIIVLVTMNAIPRPREKQLSSFMKEDKFNLISNVCTLVY